MSSLWWGWFPQPQQPWLKETLSKDRKLFQCTPDTSWKPSTHNQPSHLDQNGRSFNSPPHSVAGSFSSTHTLFSDFLFCFLHLLFFARLLFSHKNLFSSLPSHLSHPRCLPRLHIKANDWFLTVQQAVFYPSLCEETKIISMNMEKPASMVISSPVISISVELTWLNLTYIQTDGNTLLQSPLGFESHCKHWLWLLCINIPTCQGCWLSAEIDSCTESNNLYFNSVVFLAPSPSPDVKSLHLALTLPHTITTQGCWLNVVRLLEDVFQQGL